MKLKSFFNFCNSVWFSLPIQLVLLHVKRNQALLFFWIILFATIRGVFLYRFGAHMLFLYPEYLGNVNAVSTLLVGIGFAIFVMSWNITTFILYAKELVFLATTTQPFLKYCINNALIPIVFLIAYLYSAVGFDHQQELLDYFEIAFLAGGFIIGCILANIFAFTWFFAADQTIYRFAAPGVQATLEKMKAIQGIHKGLKGRHLRVDGYLSGKLRWRIPRDTSHYDATFLDRIFKQHHLSGIISMLLAFASLLVAGYFLDQPYFQLPAAASILVLFAVLIAVAGAISYFLGYWAIPVLGTVLLVFNILYENNLLDNRNKAYGIDYQQSKSTNFYTEESLLAIANVDSISADSLQDMQMLSTWRKTYDTAQPVLVVACLSGGGMRSATFAANVLQTLDVLTNNRFFQHTRLITGASGGMLGGGWYREMQWRKIDTASKQAAIQPVDAGQISADLLNPVFSSFVARDLLSPAQPFHYEGFRYTKDRGFAFEDQLNKNTLGWLDQPISNYSQPELKAQIPMMLLSPVISLDGRSLLIGSRPMRHLMRPLHPTNEWHVDAADAVDFHSLLKGRQPNRLRFLTALRMNATFPYVLPNVWLPTQPIIDVMDAGFRDNAGIENALKWIYFHRKWIAATCKKVVLVEIRDRPHGGFETAQQKGSVFDWVSRPALLTQTNLFRFQEYQQQWLLQYFKGLLGNQFERVVFEYAPDNKDFPAAMSFHLTNREKRDVTIALSSSNNQQSFKRMQLLLK